MTSSRPYLVRALYEWIVDNGFTPYLLVDAAPADVNVPGEYVEKGKIVLNVSPNAVKHLVLGNEKVTFGARFSGKSFEVAFPVQAVLAIYARENGQGMMFTEEEGASPPPETPPSGSAPGKPSLKVVK